MSYYRARTQVQLPYLLFDCIADTDEDLQDWLDANNAGAPDPLVIEISDLVNELPSYEFGICHSKVFNNAIIARDQVDIDAQQLVSEAATEIKKNDEVEEKIALNTFNYDSKEFPLGISFRSIYEAIFNSPAANHDLTTTTGTYTLLSANITAFKDAFYLKLLTFKVEFTA